MTELQQNFLLTAECAGSAADTGGERTPSLKRQSMQRNWLATEEFCPGIDPGVGGDGRQSGLPRDLAIGTSARPAGATKAWLCWREENQVG
jgi:hypothetical protein